MGCLAKVIKGDATVCFDRAAEGIVMIAFVKVGDGGASGQADAVGLGVV